MLNYNGGSLALCQDNVLLLKQGRVGQLDWVRVPSELVLHQELLGDRLEHPVLRVLLLHTAFAFGELGNEKTLGEARLVALVLLLLLQISLLVGIERLGCAEIMHSNVSPRMPLLVFAIIHVVITS